MPTDDFPPALHRLAEEQQRVALRAQLLECGVSRRYLSWRLRTQRWQRLLPGIYALFAGRVAEEERFAAAVLHGGPGSQITGAAALRWHGFRYVPPDKRILINAPRQSRRTASTGFVQVIRTVRPDRLSLLRTGFEVCSVARSVADVARRTSSLGDVRALVAEAVQRGRTSIGELFEDLEEGPMHGSALLRRVLTEIGDGVRSRPEAELRAVLARSSVLPPVRWNPALMTRSGERLPIPDGWIEEGAIALEVDSQEFHFGLEGWDNTMRRDHRLTALGIAVIHLTPARIRREPAAVRRLVEETYRARESIRVDLADPDRVQPAMVHGLGTL